MSTSPEGAHMIIAIVGKRMRIGMRIVSLAFYSGLQEAESNSRGEKCIIAAKPSTSSVLTHCLMG